MVTKTQLPMRDQVRPLLATSSCSCSGSARNHLAHKVAKPHRWAQTLKPDDVYCTSSKAFGVARRKLQKTQAVAVDTTPVGVGEIADVEDVIGIRILSGEDNRPLIEYLVKWKDGVPPTWEPVENLADNLLRDFEEKWWRSCREGDEETIKKLLENSRNVLPHCVDSNERSALHFAAALGKAKICSMMCEAGAEVDYPDKDGYTPLHMAVGYSHVSTVKVLLEAGGNPEIPDNQGRNVVQLVDSIRDQMPLNPQLAAKRIALEEVSALLTGNLFEEVVPKKILEARTTPNGSKEYLVQWLDGLEDSWVKESDMAKDVIEDYEGGLEYAEAERLLKMKGRGDQRLYLVKWLDGSPNSWEFEDNISPALVAAFEADRSGEGSQDALLPEPLTEKPPSKRAVRRAKKAARRAASAEQQNSRPTTSAASNGASSEHEQVRAAPSEPESPSNDRLEAGEQQNGASKGMKTQEPEMAARA